jgi:hypothetical protein
LFGDSKHIFKFKIFRVFPEKNGFKLNTEIMPFLSMASNSRRSKISCQGPFRIDFRIHPIGNPAINRCRWPDGTAKSHRPGIGGRHLLIRCWRIYRTVKDLTVMLRCKIFSSYRYFSWKRTKRPVL